MFKKYLIIIFLFLSFLSFPKISLAETTPVSSPAAEIVETESNFLSRFFQFISNIFAKKYDIDPNRTPQQIRQDQSDFGDINKPQELAEKHSDPAHRFNANKNQDCLKGKIIKEAVLNPRKDEVIAKICFTETDLQTCRFVKKSQPTSGYSVCTNVKISNLAYYLLQSQTQIYCNNNNQKIPTEEQIINAIYTLNPTPISSNELPCYNGVYNDFFITEQNPDNPNEEENTIQIMKTPLPARSQDDNDKVTELNKKNEVFLSSQKDIDNNKASFSNLRPENDK